MTAATPVRRPRAVRVSGDLFHPRVPVGAVYVGRAAPGLARSPYANPFRAARTLAGRAEATQRYRAWLLDQSELLAAARAELVGRDLACWCPLDGGACHRDVLLFLVNQPSG